MDKRYDTYDHGELFDAYAWGVFSTVAAAGGGMGTGLLVAGFTGFVTLGVLAGLAVLVGVIWLAGRKV